jgi:hypothetical protein
VGAEGGDAGIPGVPGSVRGPRVVHEHHRLGHAGVGLGGGGGGGQTPNCCCSGAKPHEPGFSKTIPVS